MTPPNPPGYPPPGGGYPPQQQPPYPQQPGYQPQQAYPPGNQQPGYQQPGYQQPGYPPPGYQQQPGYPPGMQPPQGQPPKKSNVLMWVLIGVGGFVLLLVLAGAVGSYVLYRTVKNVGFDSELMQKNPGLAMAKMVTAMNPDYQTVTTNDSAGTITVREKSTGKMITLRFDPDKKSMVVVDENGQEAKISVTGDGNNGGIEIQSPDGKVAFGAGSGGTPPSWVPTYPGATQVGVATTQTADGDSYSYGFKTPDAGSKVISYFQDALKQQGYTVNQVVTTGEGGMLGADDAGKKHTIVLIVANANDGTNVSITAVQKK